MSELVGRMKEGIKKGSGDFLTFSLKLLSGIVIGLVLALIAHEIMGRQNSEASVSFWFIILVVTAIFMRVAKNWSLAAVLVFDLVCVLVGIILKLYITVAPGA